MKLDFTQRGRVVITVFEYLKEIIIAFDKADPTGGGTKTSATPSNLFKVDEDCEKLNLTKSKEFHNILMVRPPLANVRSTSASNIPSWLIKSAQGTLSGLVPNRRYDRRLHDKVNPGSLVQEVPRPDYGSNPCASPWSRQALKEEGPYGRMKRRDHRSVLDDDVRDWISLSATVSTSAIMDIRNRG
jgi:hypothetical protein